MRCGKECQFDHLSVWARDIYHFYADTMTYMVFVLRASGRIPGPKS